MAYSPTRPYRQSNFPDLMNAIMSVPLIGRVKDVMQNRTYSGNRRSLGIEEKVNMALTEALFGAPI